MSKTSITPRKLPSQKRSRETVERIMSATVSLLEEIGIEGVTAINVAKKAGVNVASFYQYFPNKNAVIFAVFQSWLDWVMTVFDSVEETYLLKISWPDFMIKLGYSIFKSSFISDKAAAELLRIMEMSPELKEMNEKHGAFVVARLAEYLKKYGSKWSDEDLRDMATFLFYSSNSLFRNAAEQDEKKKQLFMEWSGDILLTLTGRCFEKE